MYSFIIIIIMDVLITIINPFYVEIIFKISLLALNITFACDLNFK